MGFLPRVAGLSLRDRVSSSAIQRELRVELLLHIEKSQLRWFGHLIMMPPGNLRLDIQLGEIIHPFWPGEHLGIPQQELKSVARDV